jgi:hypothetical protein
MLKKTNINLTPGIQGNNKIIDGKAIIISGDVHQLMKDYSKKHGLSLAFLTEQLFLEKLKHDIEIK